MNDRSFPGGEEVVLAKASVKQTKKKLKHMTADCLIPTGPWV
jgi:hypothetical protein